MLDHSHVKNCNQVIALNERDMDASKGLLQSKELYACILNTSVQPREAETLKESRMATSNPPHKMMCTATNCGQLISLLLKLVDAKKTIELGVFTSYSLLATALALPEEGQIIAIDKEAEAYQNIGLPIMKKAGVEQKIKFVHSPALPVLNEMWNDPEHVGSFDFVC